MNKFLLSTTAAVILLTSSCTSLNSPKEEKHKTELTLHKIRTEVEDLKHDLNTSDIELHILEGKLIDQEETIAFLKDQLIDQQNIKYEEMKQALSIFNKKLLSFEKKHEEILSDLKQLAQHANETTSALSQYKDKISEVEKNVYTQNKKFDEISKVKKNLESMNIETTSYVIKEGDSLQKISKHFNISVEEIKKANHLKDDLIFSGQSITIPKHP